MNPPVVGDVLSLMTGHHLSGTLRRCADSYYRPAHLKGLVRRAARRDQHCSRPPSLRPWPSPRLPAEERALRPATTLRHYVRLTTAARAKAVAGLDEVTRAALERAEEKVLEDAQLPRDNVVSLASRRR